MGGSSDQGDGGRVPGTWPGWTGVPGLLRRGLGPRYMARSCWSLAGTSSVTHPKWRRAPPARESAVCTPDLAGTPPVTFKWRKVEAWVPRRGHHLNPVETLFPDFKNIHSSLSYKAPCYTQSL